MIAAQIRRLALLALTLISAAAAGQSLVELRLATSRYRFVDFNHTFANKVVFDALVFGVPGNDELYLGVGRQWQIEAVSLTPLAYAVAGTAEGERGFAVGSVIYAQSGGWNTVGFLGHFVPTAGKIPHYTFLDSLDLTRKVSSQWEIGVSTGFFRIGGAWNALAGPMVKWIDAHGFWGLSARAGGDPEVRLVRVLTF